MNLESYYACIERLLERPMSELEQLGCYCGADCLQVGEGRFLCVPCTARAWKGYAAGGGVQAEHDRLLGL